MPSLKNAIFDTAKALLHIAEEISRLTKVQNQLALEQRITNLIVRSQIEADQEKKAGLLTEARRLMDRAGPGREPATKLSPRRAARSR